MVENNHEWKNIQKVVLNVNSIDLVFEDFLKINFGCGFENIAKGRCQLVVTEKKKKKSDNLYVHTDQALMIVNVFYEKPKLERLISTISKKKSNSKKIKIYLEISESLMVNKTGYLYVKDNLNIKVDSVIWKIPII